MLKKISYYTSTLDESDPLKRLCNPLDLLLFDIETTGFHRANDQVISITAAQVSSVNSLGEYTWEITQWFTESLDDEKIMLLDANILFKTKPIHITYNGHSFDIPFLHYKYKYYNIFTSLNKSKCYDFYRIARHSLKLDSYKLKAIEIALDIHREDLISGKECVDLYRAYEITKNPDIPDKILLHNYEDVLNMIRLSKILLYTPEAYLESIRVIAIDFGGLEFNLNHHQVTDLHLDLIFTAQTASNPQFSLVPSHHYYDTGEFIRFTPHEDEMKIEIKLAISKHQVEDHDLVFVAGSNDSIAQKSNIHTLEDLLISIDHVLQWDRLVKLIYKVLHEKSQL